jgi:hypothetical protein
MATTKAPLTERPGWKALQSHYRDIREEHLRQWFAEDATRGGAPYAPAADPHGRRGPAARISAAGSCARSANGRAGRPLAGTFPF